VVVGGGDDAAVLRPSPGADLVATTDTFVENRHYRSAPGTKLFTPRLIGARLARANLSDLAAMAARPRWALLSLGVRPEHELDDLIELETGLGDALAHDGAVVAGGNLVAVEGAEWLSLTLLGEATPGRAWQRVGARHHDLIAVTGFPGRAGAGARLGTRSDLAPRAEWQPLIDAWVRPDSRVRLALALASLEVVTAAIDISDGFAGDLAHLCEASGVGAEVDATAWPEDPLLMRAAAALGMEADALTFGPSDDYELLLTVAPTGRAACEETARKSGVRLVFVGSVTGHAGTLVHLDRQGHERPLTTTGYDHFR
jgi:thiamine-monophosphate kinase